FAESSNQLAQGGLVAFSVNYRLAPAHPFPAAVEDVEAAVAWVRKHAKDYGVDPKRIGALGGSAGAHLVGMLATDGGGSLKTGHRVAAGGALAGAQGPRPPRPPPRPHLRRTTPHPPGARPRRRPQPPRAPPPPPRPAP